MMDELLFRTSQKLENLQVRASLTASQGKELLQHYSIQGRTVALNTWNNPHLAQARENLRELWQVFVNEVNHVQQELKIRLDPKKIMYNIKSAISDVILKRWTKRDVYFLTIGFACGTIAGIIVARIVWRRQPAAIRYMQAVQCNHYLGIESVCVVEDAIAPALDSCGPNDVIVDVRAASVHVVDARICSGYGRSLRRILRRLHQQSAGDLPVALGRDCSGIIVDLGRDVVRKRHDTLAVGDAVWLTVPYWSEGTMAQTVRVPEHRVARKPTEVAWEAACSLPYAGCVALDALRRLGVSERNAPGLRVLVLGGCTPAGCILIQILTLWKAHITTTCFKRALPVAQALGASEILVWPNAIASSASKNPDPIIKQSEIEEKTQEKENHQIDEETIENNHGNDDDLIAAFKKELSLKDKFDVIIVTQATRLSEKDVNDLCKQGTEGVVSTLPEDCASDSCGWFTGFFLETYIRLKYFIERTLRQPNDHSFDEALLCRHPLNRLKHLVETGRLQTVVEKVFRPEDIEIALNHIQSSDSIGSSVITFS